MNKARQVDQYVSNSLTTMVQTPTLSIVSQTPDLKEQIGGVIANVSSLPSFLKQNQQIYNVLKGIDDADKTNQQNYGAQRWDSTRALPTVYAVMQDIVNITNNVNNVM